MKLTSRRLYIGVNSVELKTEADDVSECSCDDQPTTGLFGLLIYRVFCITIADSSQVGRKIIVNILVHPKLIQTCFEQVDSIYIHNRVRQTRVLQTKVDWTLSVINLRSN